MEIRYTDEQLEAITTPVYNTMISAGAGSGKTKVLTQRVFNHLANNIDVDRLLVLTFTNAAAAEMKQRVIKLLVEDNSLDPDLKKAQLNKIDSAYIMTFDAYSLFLVKKYHQLLNVDKDIDIADSNIINGITDKFLDEIFEQQYVSNDIFKDIISKYCVKDDDVVKGFVKSLNKKLDLIYDRDNFIKTYNDLFFSTSHLNDELDSYTSLLFQKLKQVDELLNKISELDDLNRFFNNWQGINNLSSYEEIRSYVANIAPVRKKNKEEYDEDALVLKDKIKDIIKEINELTKYDKSTLINDVLINKDYVNCLLDLAEELNRRINIYKKENNFYDFIDIAKLAIEVVDKNDEIRESIKNNFYEILIDEYQDTSDIQELLISKISNNNVYVVGDIKQSIYRFRYANPDIFRTKYENYSKGINGKKIDLTNNFRSRFEVLRDINLFFNRTMSSSVGGADYTRGHQLIAGNSSYIKDDRYACEILSYEKQKGIDSAYIEAQLIADDIKSRVNTFKLKDHLCDYRDITILMDRSSKFDVFKEVLTANNIPTFIETEEKMSESDLLTVIRSIFKLLVNYDKHAYISLERSFLCETSDEDIFNNITNNQIFTSPTYIKINDIKTNIDTKTISNILDEIIESFDVYSKLVKIKDVHASNVK
ncbi:MAG: UvrD-helicase domain-containing protein, partial [Solobacterium sp.]|nr:UvrD-helicase domain-containing protein [Solobacterium sp.]